MVEITAFRLENYFPPMRVLEFIRDHVTFKLSYDFSYQMKTPLGITVLSIKNMKKTTLKSSILQQNCKKCLHFQTAQK